MAQEVLWYGNIYQQTYNDEQLRKNAFTIMMAGAALNFADNSGTSSTGFTGTLNLAERHQDKHEIVKKVWDFFESIPFYELTPAQNLANNGFTIAKPGKTYLTYLPSGGEVTVNAKPGNYLGVWIKGSDINVRVNIGITDGQNLVAPSADDWLLYLQTANAEAISKTTSLPFFAGFGSYPDVTADKNGILHIVYARNGKLYYRNYCPKKNQLSQEIYTTLTYLQDKYPGPNRSDPEIKVESCGKIHVLVGQQYACWDGKEWINTDPAVTLSGKVFVVSQDGVIFALDNSSFSFYRECKILNCHERELPSLSVGNQNRVRITAFGGIYNFLQQDNPGIEKKLSAVTGKPIGFTESVSAGNSVWVIHEEGELVSKEDMAGVSAIFLKEINP